MVMTSDEPPKEMNGSGMPVTGSTPDHRADVDDRLGDDPGHQADGEQAAEAVRCPGRRPQAEPGEGAEEGEHGEGADQAQLLADDREDEVGVGVGQVAPLLRPVAETRGRRGGPSPAR